MSAVSREPQPFVPGGRLDRALDFGRVRLDVLAFVGVLLLSILAHLWGLGRMAMHHDESIHAWMSWKFFTGNGGFTCAGGRASFTYCYDPVYHGPSLYILTFFSYFLFGISETTARLPEAAAGILLVASTWLLRPYLGRRGTVLAAILLSFTPTLLYYTRFARHDALILLWTMWMVIGFFRFLESGGARWLLLLFAGAALAIGTHELYYILFFLFGLFFLIRLAAELLPRRVVMLALGMVGGISLILMVFSVPIGPLDRVRGLELLLTAVLWSGLAAMRIWDGRPLLMQRFAPLVSERSGVLVAALALFGALYLVMYSVFFVDMVSALDGLYRGLQYWLGSQHEYARGDQPWYYYVMQMALYEPLGLFAGIAITVALFVQRPAPRTGDEIIERRRGGVLRWQLAPELTRPEARQIVAGMLPLFLAFWFVGAFFAFSWAGEKMPWLVTHIALPANLLVAWALGWLLDTVAWRSIPRAQAWLIPPALVLALVALGVAFVRIGSGGDGTQQALAQSLQGLLPLLIAGGLLYLVLTIWQRVGTPAARALVLLTLSGILGVYMIRATWMVVYDHPDTPRELLVYTQSSPDVPIIVNDIKELAVTLTRNSRSESDPIGGLTMPVIMDIGDTSGEGSLAWPFQWYLRDFKRLESRNADFFRTATADSFLVAGDNGDQVLAPVVMVSKTHMTDQTRQALEANYVRRWGSKLNWWFPEGNKCDPNGPGYKRFYYSGLTDIAVEKNDCPSAASDPASFGSVLSPLLWPFDRSHWPETWRFIMYREMPAALRLDGREMEVWMRGDLVGGGDTAIGGSATGASTVKLVAQQVFGAPGTASGQLNDPRGVAVDAAGNVYVADTMQHRIQVFAPDGGFVREFGSKGAGEGQFNEPRGVALDAEGNIYVADTWNARIVKLANDGTFISAWGSGDQDMGDGRRATITDGTLEGNAAQPLGFFGPRSIAVDGQGRVYLADTGNKRVVVTDGQGQFLFQFGSAGSEPGQFNEPIGIAVDGGGNVYVGDTWNSRVQVFSPEGEQVSAIPSITWPVSGWRPDTYDDPALTVAPDGTVYVSLPASNEIVAATQRGDVLLRWGGAGNDFASLTLPSGSVVGPDGRVYVVDRGNGRVLSFRLPNAPAEN